MYKKCLITAFEELKADYFVLMIEDSALAQVSEPGQFFNLSCSDGDIPRLKKPISIYDVDGSEIAFMIKKVGKGTEYLSKLKVGDSIDVLGPLGNPFPLVSGKSVLMVSGGVGYPPLVYLKKKLEDCEVISIHGGRSYDDIFLCDYPFTEDGSYGRKGLVTAHLEKIIKKHKIEVIYTCGPDSMMKAIGRKALELNIDCYLSLEEYMACGIGACYGCAVKVKADNEQGYIYKRVCKDGPVFEVKELWMEDK
ncbi:MAG: dihydroorotate dehydrogenase electron transfer subunit [Candidatus Cloacimonetes bacterium]|nr:dihydroorotate dehydrogenase electron transfer subunit [Candidatus Cloacimonadota bacterium]